MALEKGPSPAIMRCILYAKRADLSGGREPVVRTMHLTQRIVQEGALSVIPHSPPPSKALPESQKIPDP